MLLFLLLKGLGSRNQEEAKSQKLRVNEFSLIAPIMYQQMITAFMELGAYFLPPHYRLVGGFCEPKTVICVSKVCSQRPQAKLHNMLRRENAQLTAP
jgi:hypothetical protein